jgi:hypothetical protein
MKMRTITSPVRKCGLRKEHGVYAVGGEDGSEDGVLERFTLIKPPIPYPVKLHRIARLVDANEVLGRSPMDEWWFGSSKDTEIKKKGDAWALDVFGMTIPSRLKLGECKGLSSPEEALGALAGKIEYHVRLVDYFRNLTNSGVPSEKMVSSVYAKLHEHLLLYAKHQRVGDLMGAQASLWQMAFNVPPRKRQDYIPNIMRMLALMNLPKDAIAMQKLFLEKKNA